MRKFLAGLVLFSVVLAGCSKDDGGAGDEKQRFIDATVEVTCLVFQSEDLLDPTLEQKSKDVFTKYGFAIDDEAAMKAIADKYEDDKDVQEAVTKALDECGGELFKKLKAGGEDAPASDAVAPATDESAPTAEVPDAPEVIE